MKLSSRKQLLKEAEEELETIKQENRLNESEIDFLIDRLKRDAVNFKKFDYRYSDMINGDNKKINVSITAKVPVSVYYDIENEEVRYDISENMGMSGISWSLAWRITGGAFILAINSPSGSWITFLICALPFPGQWPKNIKRPVLLLQKYITSTVLWMLLLLKVLPLIFPLTKKHFN